MAKLGRKQIKRKYDQVADPDKLEVFDGRNKGVDVYHCASCGAKMYARYKDKGVTPFILVCRKCHGVAEHDNTISEEMAANMGVEVKNWVRPSFEWVMKHRKNESVLDHILNGGLLLEDEL